MVTPTPQDIDQSFIWIHKTISFFNNTQSMIETTTFDYAFVQDELLRNFLESKEMDIPSSLNSFAFLVYRRLWLCTTGRFHLEFPRYWMEHN